MTHLTDPELRDALGSLSHMTPGYPFSLLAARRTAFLDAVHIQNLMSYLWDEEDGSDTSMSTQLDDAGFGSGGVY